MNKFDFYNPTHIVFGRDRLTELDGLIPEDAKILILFGGGSVQRFGTLAKVKEALGKREIIEFGGIEPNPRFSTLVKAVKVVQEENIDFLLAVGGGSVMDGTKFISLAAQLAPEEVEAEFYQHFASEKIKKALPIGNVVTLPATGSEMNCGGVISHKAGKHVISNPLVYPKFSFLDPALTFTLPKRQVANGIIDTFIHTTEQYVTYDVNTKLQDRMAEGILQTLVEIAKDNMEKPEDYDSRANLMWCATMALNGLLRCGVVQDWTTHMIGHELTARFGLDHAVTLAILQPAIWKVRKEQKKDKLLQYARRVWNITEGTDDEIIDTAIAKTAEFFQSLGVKSRLSEYDITEDELSDILAGLERNGLTRLSERGDIDLAISKEILLKAM